MTRVARQVAARERYAQKAETPNAGTRDVGAAKSGRRAGLRAAALLSLCAALVWAGGFAWFLRVATQPPRPAPLADGIVALTGGAERVETALHLLAEGRARRLLVSGVNRAADFAELARRADVAPVLAARVTLGKMASDTHGNALETAAWARDNAVGSLIVVTAGYHMPRALAELSRTLPNVTLYPYPVLSPVLRGIPDAAGLRLLAGEYTKWLAAEARLSWHAFEAADEARALTSHQSEGRCCE